MSIATLKSLLLAIAMVETGNDPTAIGRAQETGAHQMTPAAIREHQTPEARARYIERELRRHGLKADPFTVALAWNAGLGAVSRGEIRPVSWVYAVRVENIMEASER